MVGRWVAAGMLLFAGTTVSAHATPADAVRGGDMEAMIPEIIALYEDSGLSWNPAIEWTIGPFTTTFWYYDPNTDVIMVGAVPADDEVAAYWQTWSEVLTDGNFDPDGFFVSTAEARDLARYNQFVLAVHESAHAITFRYDYEHLRRHDWDVNCREYYADRLTVAVLNGQAGLDPDMAGWRARYLELVTAMGETIPDEHRYRIPDFATLDADCAVIDVAQPTPETMQPYASAYFERYRVLLEADLPPMREVFETHLTGALARRLADVPFAPERDALELVTLGDRDAVRLGSVFNEAISSSQWRSRAAAFDPDGQLWFATLTHDSDTRLVELTFGTDAADSPATGVPTEWHRPSRRLEIASLAVVAPDVFLTALLHWERSEDGEETHYATWILARQVDGVWEFTGLAEVDEMHRAAVLRAPDNRVFLLGSIDPTRGRFSANWRGLEIELETGEIVGDLPIASAHRQPAAIDGEGRLYEQSSYLLWRAAPGSGEEVIAGNGLGGPRDGAGASAEMTVLHAMQWMSDGRALLVESGPGLRGWITRELRGLE